MIFRHPWGGKERFTGNAEKKAALIAGVPLKRMGRPEEVAQTILFLASDNAPFITGQIFGIDGGKWLEVLDFPCFRVRITTPVLTTFASQRPLSRGRRRRGV